MGGCCKQEFVSHHMDLAAYEHMVGEKWKPFERQAEAIGETVGKAAFLQMAAFE
jgi:hypothetical protein